MKIILKTGKPRFDQLGDWPTYDEIIVAEQNNWRSEFLIALHELVEAQICKARGISPEMVDTFDANWNNSGEPGDSPQSPYFIAHQVAMIVERLVGRFLDTGLEKWEIE